MSLGMAASRQRARSQAETRTTAHPWAGALAALVAVTAVVVSVATIGFAWGRPGSDGVGPFGLPSALRVVAYAGYALVGGLVASRRPTNPIGWIFLVGGAAMTLQLGLEEYAHAAIVLDAGRYPAAATVAWITEFLWVVPMAALQFSTLLFPTGRLPSPRWRLYAAILVGGDLLLLVLAPLATWPLRGRLAAMEALTSSPLWLVLRPVSIAMVVAVLLSAFSLVVRYRRARGDERYQLRWLAFAALVLIAGLAVENQFSVEAVDGASSRRAALAAIAGTVGTIALPLAAAFAILKRNLYDIDRIISRTLGYAVVTAVLVGCYLGMVVTFGAAARAITGESGDLVVALSTLAVAALFQPVRRRIQAAVDHRFNRGRYDAAQTVDGFARSLRDELDLGRLTDDLALVARGTMQPAHAGIWLARASSGAP